MTGWSKETGYAVEFGTSYDAPMRGGVGVVDALIGMLKHCDQAIELERDELLVMTSVGVKHYLYEELYNPAYEPARYFSAKGELFSNYGVFESFEQHTNYEIREFNFLSAGDLAKLLAYELGDNRAVLSWGVGDRDEVVWITGVSATPTTFEVTIRRGNGEESVIDLRQRGGKLQGEDDEDFVNWCVVARPKGGEVAWALSAEKRFELMLKWAYKHGMGRKEFFHETRENYATGLAAYETLVGSVSARLDELDGEQRDRFQMQVQGHLDELAEGRGAMGRHLASYGDDYAEIASAYKNIAEGLSALSFENSDVFAQEVERLAAQEREVLKLVSKVLS